MLVVSFLYSYPFYRGKRYFPSNLKIEGVWGAASFLTGAISALENQASAGPFWGGPAAPVLGPFPWQTVVAAALVFGGYSVVAALKDYKDWEADLQAGVQTLYTLAQRRSWPFLRVHRLIVALAAICLALPCPLLAWAGRLHPAHSAGGVALALLVAKMAWSPESARRFGRVLVGVDASLACVLIALLA